MHHFFRSSLLFATVVVMLSSCTIEQDYHFKNDMSGSYQTRLDLSMLSAMGGEESAMDTVFKQEDLDEMTQQYQSMPGLSNVITSYENNVFTTGFDFANLESLSKAFAAQGSEEGQTDPLASGGLFKFTRKGKKMTINVNRDSADDLNSEESEGMGEMVSFKVNMKFDQPIKKFSSKVATLNKETNTVTYDLTWSQYIDKKLDLSTTIKFK